MAFYIILPAMTLDGSVEVPHEWYKQLASKAGKSVPPLVRSRAARESSQRHWATRRRKYGKTGHASPYAERKESKAA